MKPWEPQQHVAVWKIAQAQGSMIVMLVTAGCSHHIVCIWLDTSHTLNMLEKTSNGPSSHSRQADGSSLMDVLAYLVQKSMYTTAWAIESCPANCKAATRRSTSSHCVAPLRKDHNALPIVHAPIIHIITINCTTT